MLVKEARRSKDKQLPIDLDDITAYIEKTVSLLVQTSNYITYLRGHNILAALSCLVQQSKEMLRGEVDLWKWHDKNFLGKKYSKHLVDSAKKNIICWKGREKTKALSKYPFRSIYGEFWCAAFEVIPRQKIWEIEAKDIRQKLSSSN